ncbi:DUF6318 family protein [Nocardioides sp. cx-173]|uniref:DUF6318 family protein n=1 Tax=Nocardioides sp. cx-173 TaxID=2898796 RepID=UPI001E3BFD74|nr:DUF6318 family protein [Nocardioides sp. cx-173]MCD4527139.1 DUF6318 family protein [Nocardioides sp. cx-173]UGB42502.1 DUF6318 family protein [Nocardioides sp. cx-173]
MDRVRLAALLVATTLVAAACSDDAPEPRVEPTPSASPTESALTPSPSSSESDAPITAVQAVRNWVAERNLALSSGDTSALRKLASPGCSTCEPYVDLIEDVYEAGGEYNTTGWTVDRAKELKPGEVTAAITMGGGSMVPSSGAEADEYGEEKAIFRFRLTSDMDTPAITFIGLIR